MCIRKCLGVKFVAVMTILVTLSAGGRLFAQELSKAVKSTLNVENNEEDDDETVINLDSLPTIVRGAILAKFSGAKLNSAILETEDDAQALYEIKFTHQHKNLEAKVDAKGIISETKEHLALNKLPVVISSVLKNIYPKAKVLEVEKVLGENTVYEVELVAGDEKIESVLDESGKVLKHKIDSDNEEDNDNEDKDNVKNNEEDDDDNNED